MHKRLSYILLFVTVMILTSHSVMAQDVKLVIDGKPVASTPTPEIQQDRVFVPLRIALEQMGATVDWIAANNQVVVSKAPLVAKLTIGSSKVTYADGTTVDMLVSPYIKDGRTMVPIRFLAQGLGYNVNWNGTLMQVELTQQPPLPPPPPPAAELLTIYQKGNELNLAIDGYEPFELSSMEISSPRRLVLDLKGVEPADDLIKQTFSPDPRILNVRYALNSSNPAVTRVVVELAPDVSYKVDKGDNWVKVVFGDPVIKPFDPAKPLKGWVIAVDAGHGGTDPGAKGYSGTSFEKNDNLAVALLVRDKLVAQGAQVIMTRTTDETVSLRDRVVRALAGGADIFLCIHSDSYPSISTQGSTGLYQPGRDYQQELAQQVHASYLMATGRITRGVREQDLYVLRNSPIPGVLVEMGFISNPEEEKLLKDPVFQNKAAIGMTNGLLNYVSMKATGKPSPVTLPVPSSTPTAGTTTGTTTPTK